MGCIVIDHALLASLYSIEKLKYLKKDSEWGQNGKKGIRNSTRIATCLSFVFGLIAAGNSSSALAAEAQSRSPAPNAPNTGSSTTGGIQDIVVTAEKRSTTVQRAPAAITVVSGDALVARGIQNIQQAALLAPGLKLGGEGTSTQAFIRGVGAILDSSNIEPAVAVNFDGVYIPREATGGTNLFDIDRVEVLPGPQGTLYGRSATGGVINFNFKRPANSFGGELLAEYGNFNYKHLFGAINIPASSSVKFRLSANYDNEDGYFKSGAGNQDDLGLRASTVITPNDRLSIYLWGSYVGHRGSTPNAVNYPLLNPRDPYDDLQPSYLQPFGQVTRGKLHQDIYIASGQVDYKADGFTVSYIPSYFDTTINNFVWLAGLPNQIHYGIKQESNDLRVTTSSSSKLKLLGGLYQFDQTYRDYKFVFPFGNIYDIPLSKEYGVAAYAQGNYSLASRLRLILGARYSSTKRRADANEFLGPAVPAKPFTFDVRYNHFDWKVGAEADVGSASMLYAIVQTGFNPGTYNNSPSVPGLSLKLKPTKLRSYTFGLKNRLWDNKLQLNFEGFYYDYRDLLVTAFNTLTGQQQVYNANKVAIYGAQADARIAFSRYTQINGAVGYLHAENKDFVVPQLVGPALNYNGLAPPYSPRWTINLGAAQTIPLGAAGTLVARVDSHHETKAFGEFTHDPGTDVTNYWKTDASLTYTPMGERVSVSAWVHNIENTVHAGITSVGGIPGPAAIILERPRTYGMRLGYKF